MNQKGFINIAIIIGIVVITGAIGYFALNNRQVQPPTTSQPQAVEQSETSQGESNNLELVTYITPRDLAIESNEVFKFQYPKGFTVTEGGYKTPGGFRFPAISIQKNNSADIDAVRVPGGISTGPEITCKTQAAAGDKCVEVKGHVVMTKSKDQSVFKAYEIITSTFEVSGYGTLTDTSDPVDNNPNDGWGWISGEILAGANKQVLGGAEITVRARPVDLAPDGKFSLRSFDSGAVLIGRTTTDQYGRFSIRVPLGIVNNPLKELNRLNMFIVSAKKNGYEEMTNMMVQITDGKTTRVDFELSVDQGPRG